MNTDLTPPAATAPAATPPPSPPRTSARVVAITAIVVGGVIILGTLSTALASTLWAAGDRMTGSRSAEVGGVSRLVVDVASGDVDVVYADAARATLQIDGNPRNWSLERRGDELHVSNSRPWWAGWNFGSWTDRATLTLPTSLADADLDATFDVAAGSLSATGDYDEVDLHVGAGEAELSGTARSVSVDVSAGRADVDLDGVAEGALDIGAGEIVASLNGTVRDLTVDVSAGSLTASVPDTTYDVTSDVSAGSLDNQLSTASDAPRSIQVDVSAGDVTLLPLP